jgi:hypothetical protein
MAKNEGQEQKPLITDETGCSNLNLQQKMCDFSPEDVRGYPKAGKRKNERKGLTKGKSLVDSITPELKSILQKKNNR